MKYLRKFNHISDYNSELSGGTLDKPNVSLVVDAAVVKYLADIEDIYRWVNLDPAVDYECDTNTHTKYYKQKKQVSHNSGATWEDIVPAEYRRGEKYQEKSRDCGYSPKLYATYTDEKEYELQCNSSTRLTVEETQPSGYQKALMKTAAIGSCVLVIDDIAFRDCESMEEIIIPTGITSLSQHAFNGCTKLKHCIFDKGSHLTNLGLYTFYGCVALESFDIPNGVTEIGYQCFQGCTSLSSVTVPNSVTMISSNAFYECSSLDSLTLPSGVTSIGMSAFRNCSSLTDLTIYATTPPTLGITAFSGISNIKIYVPDESVDAYKNATNWRSLAASIKPISEK